MDIEQKSRFRYPVANGAGIALALMFFATVACVAQRTLVGVLPLEQSHADTEGTVFKGGRGFVSEYCMRKGLLYFHSGAYYSIFDSSLQGEPDISEFVDEKGVLPESERWRKETPFAGPALDFLDRFGRNFFPTGHTHLTEGGASGGEENLVYEVLPWLEMAVRADPHAIQAYEEADYWLRTHLNRPDEAAGFLRRGLVANPKSYQILFLLGEIAAERGGDYDLARRNWNRALALWLEQNTRVPEPDNFAFRQIACSLARLEEDLQNYPRSLELVEMVRQRNPGENAIDLWVCELEYEVHYRPEGEPSSVR